jgi:hypothetical protein
MWVAGIAALLFAAWMAGRRDQRQQSAVEAAESYTKTRKDIHDVGNAIEDDPAVLREWLLQRGKQ